MLKRKKYIKVLIAAAVVTSISSSFLSNLTISSVSAIEIEAAAEVETTPKLGVSSIDEVISAMTLNEKANLVVGGNRGSIGDEPVIGGESNNVPGAAGNTQAIPRLGIPSITVADGPAGVRISPTRPDDEETYYATAFPIATSIASSWDINVANEIGSAMGNELKEYGIDLLLAPALNIQRNPLNGRNFEYYSEDPLVSGKISAAISNGVQDEGVGVTIKHFAVNNQETNRQNVDAVVTERTLREVYLRGFEIAIDESEPWAVMSSYNKVNGVSTAENPELLTDILREEWNFDGLVMTDWGGGKDTTKAMIAQNDLLMPGGQAKVDAIIKAVNNGELNEENLDRNVANILKVIIKTNSFDNYEYSNKPNLDENAKVSRKAATEGMVLLKNEDNTLPLKTNKQLGLYGTAQIETIKGGTGSGDVYSESVINIVDGFKNANVNIDTDLVSSYTQYINNLREQDEYKITEGRFGKVIPVIPELQISLEKAKEQAAINDVGIIVIGRNSGEFADRAESKGDYYLTDIELENINNISEAYHEVGKKIIVLLNVGGQIEMESWKNKVDSILLTWQPGQSAGDSIADVVLGEVNPSGKLASTFSKTYDDNSSSSNFPGNDPIKPTEVIHEEDMYVGYRYFSTFDVETSYEFGYGLSYTDFEYSNINIDKSVFDESITAYITVKNVGNTAGKEVVQLYLNEPDGKLEKAEIQLRSFGKTDLLQPGESETLEFKLSAKDFKSYDEETSSWIVEKGVYEVRIGASSKDIKGSTKFIVDKNIIVQDVENKVVPQKEINTLKKPVKEIVIQKVVNLEGKANKNEVSLTWDTPSSNFGITGYIIYKDGKEVEEVPVGTTMYTSTDLKENTIYGFKVVTKYSNGKVSKPVSINVRTKK